MQRYKWGSSRAVANIGQECFTCAAQGKPNVMVTPFRLEVVVKKRANGRRGGFRRRIIPRKPIPEHDAAQREYTARDRERNASGARQALVRGTGSYEVVPRRQEQNDDDSSSSFSSNRPAPTTVVVVSNNRIPTGYRHKCSGCAKGLCKRRTLPQSQVHDVSDGDTVSTSASVVTNSSVDKAEYYNRDEDFGDFLEDDENEEWIEV